ncbi:MAG: hypothetical protein GY942_17245, partial [Aestuariibacter sp.]|nr:hypothetical protein [Aestuariibacter sp.]
NTGDYDQHRMLVFGVDDNDDVWSAFPLLNDKDSQFEHYFDWDIAQGQDLLELPIGAQIPQAQLSVSSVPGAQTQLGESNSVSYQASVTNLGSIPIDGVQLTFSGTTGLSFSTVSGGSCANCVGNEWLVDVPQIAIGATQVVTVAGSTVADLTTIDTVSTTITLSSQTVSLAQEVVEHVVDITAPTGSFDQTPGDVVNGTQPIISGTADDGVGVGVSLVEVRVDGGAWQDAAGKNQWSASTAPGAGA